ncbi:glucose-1-phosphate thymidylyltransferase RfbA [Porphyromonas sp.]|uniref:glucose-1-phosphate thymidylyltransferase RfbA n=1 Tax=Porphyromonas sp. TaxID=1924944 RepID=UPI0026DC0A4D|nr:glucose-1-phosphate thymidylyltransferase RfbA [Porphyromonas sp.]MDO4695410.1 glucose-1-phosphate thymidylyltransferase RfbA [Porphyromonas sp.]MDO4770542.1 glucose-1-phosphate thymidylyltransferase RfbA [Porphyromonas sp.]
MRGIILAGGSGTRLYPATLPFSKQLIPLYDKPMIYYPLSVLMLAGIREVLIITTPDDRGLFEKLLGDGSQWGMELTYAVQPKPEGIAQAFLIGKEFIGTDSVCLILGDNVFYGQSFTHTLRRVLQHVEQTGDAVIFSYYVRDPERYGVVEFDSEHRAISIEEKPQTPKSNYAVVGLYFYPPSIVDVAAKVKPSARGELEITSVNQYFLEANQLRVEPLGRGFAWLDTGTHESLYEAGDFVRAIEQRQGLKIACLEEIALTNGWIDKGILLPIIDRYKGSDYALYLESLINRFG